MDREVPMLNQNTVIVSRVLAKTRRLCAALLAPLSVSVTGCALWIYDDGSCCPPPPISEPYYVVPEPMPVAEPGVYMYAPPQVYSPAPVVVEGYFRGQAKEDKGTEASTKNVETSKKTSDAATVCANYLTRGQAQDGSDFPSTDAFPSIDDSLAPPESSEIGDFPTKGTVVPEPTGQYETSDYDDENFKPKPKRESLAEREKAEEKIEKNFSEWLRQKKEKRIENDKKTKRYLQPIEDPDDNIFAREEQLLVDKEDEGIIKTVTIQGLEMMLENEESQRELYDWEKDEPMPVDWSKYAISIDNIRAWFGMGPDERAALAYMREACLKQKEYSKTKNKDDLREAAKLYEKAASRWPGPALRPEYAQKHPYDSPKSGTLIEEDGLFFAGECWFFCQEFNRALAAYRALVKTYTSSIYKETAMKRLFYIGTYWVKISEESSVPKVNVSESDRPRFSAFAGAEKAFSSIFLNDASDNGLAPDALFALANAYMRRGVKQGDGSFDVAARYYKQLYEFYPGNKHAEDASRLAMIALHKSYQGAFYDDAPLNQARELAETILKSGRGNMDVIYEELENIKDEQAHRLYALGKYYERRGNYASSRVYYNRLVKEFPNTDYAVEGAKRYEEIVAKPAEVDQLAWIRPVMPFLPKSKNQYFEEAPSEQLSKIARRDESLGSIGKDTRDNPDENVTQVAEKTDDVKRY